jgi:hypothetical protein
MPHEWYYARGDQKQGPITDQQLRALATSGELQHTDLVWTEGMAEWRKASSVKGLFPDAPLSSGPPPIPRPNTMTPSAAGQAATNLYAAGNKLVERLSKPTTVVPSEVAVTSTPKITTPPRSGSRTAVLVLCIIGAFLSFMVGGCTSAMSEGLADAGESMNRYADQYESSTNRMDTQEMRSFGQNHLMMGFLEAILGMVGGIMGFRHFGTTNRLALGGVSLSRVTIAGCIILVALMMTITNTFSFFSAGILYGVAGALCLLSKPPKIALIR